jgi:hypothetical protein
MGLCLDHSCFGGVVWLVCGSSAAVFIQRKEGFARRSHHTIPKGSSCSHSYTNGGKYVGEFRDGNFSGQGTLTSATGDKYIGEFNDGLPNGPGTQTYNNGDKYVGEFSGGNRKKEASPMLYAIGAFAPNAISCLLLCAAVALMMGRFIWL